MSVWSRTRTATLAGVVALASLTFVGVSTPSASAAVTAAGAFTPVAPARLLDTRAGVGAPAAAVPGGGSVTFTVGSRGGVPANASAVALNVTVTRTTAAGHITAYPTGSAVPTASNLNFVANQTIANAVTVKLGTGGQVTLANGSTQSVQLVADVAGWYVGGTPTAAGTFTAVAPQRLLDTREGVGATRAQVPGRGSVTFSVGGQAGVPANAVAAALNVTVTKTVSPGHVTAYPTGSAVPTASNLNFTGRQTIANAVTVKLGTNGQVTLVNGSVHPVDLVADLAGWFLPGQATVPGAFVPVTPTRLLDTREDLWAGSWSDEEGVFGPVPGGWDVWVDVEWTMDLREGSVSAGVFNVTATRPTRAGHITAYDGESDIPTASNLNFVAGQTIPNQATVGLLEFGDIGLYNGSTGSVHLIADLAGYYLAG